MIDTSPRSDSQQKEHHRLLTQKLQELVQMNEAESPRKEVDSIRGPMVKNIEHQVVSRAEICQLLETLRRSHAKQLLEQEQLVTKFFERDAAVARPKRGFSPRSHLPAGTVPEEPLAEVDTAIEVSKPRRGGLPPTSLSPGAIEASELELDLDSPPQAVSDARKRSQGAAATAGQAAAEEKNHADAESKDQVALKFLSSREKEKDVQDGSQKSFSFTSASSQDLLKMVEASGGGPLLRPLFNRWLAINHWMAKMTTEPPRKGKLAKMVDGFLFEFICFIVVLLNGAFIVVVTNYQMENLDSHNPVSFQLIEAGFLIYYFCHET
jgi:hypothetical protein